MKYESSDLLDRVAGEYVLGTLRGRARRRFERLSGENAAARAALHRWEDDFTALSRTLRPVTPSADVWPQIQRRIKGAGTASRYGRAWQLAAAASLVALGLLVGLLVREPVPLQTIAVLGTDAAHPLWRIERPKELTALTIRVIGRVELAPDRTYELWALPRDGNPVSLGVLPAGGAMVRTLSQAQRAALQLADKIAVSVEPAGGSPTGSPTGPVVIVAGVTG
jgi:anti-sigma-K factor RskA